MSIKIPKTSSFTVKLNEKVKVLITKVRFGEGGYMKIFQKRWLDKKEVEKIIEGNCDP